MFLEKWILEVSDLCEDKKLDILWVMFRGPIFSHCQLEASRLQLQAVLWDERSALFLGLAAAKQFLHQHFSLLCGSSSSKGRQVSQEMSVTQRTTNKILQFQNAHQRMSWCLKAPSKGIASDQILCLLGIINKNIISESHWLRGQHWILCQGFKSLWVESGIFSSTLFIYLFNGKKVKQIFIAK